MKYKVILFARARDLVGRGEVELELPPASNVADLRVGLAREYPALGSLAASLLVALGTNYANDTTPLADGQEIACFPPVSGG